MSAIGRIGAICLCLVAAGPVSADERSQPPLDLRFAVDPVTGFALEGYDPMSYYLSDAPRPGVPAHQARWAGLAWQFANAANRAAFLDTPEYYAPRFGGYDAVGVARNRLAAVDPEIFVIHDGRLYLFSSIVHRLMFLEAPEQFVADAEEYWPELRDIAPLAIGLGEG